MIFGKSYGPFEIVGADTLLRFFFFELLRIHLAGRQRGQQRIDLILGQYINQSIHLLLLKAAIS